MFFWWAEWSWKVKNILQRAVFVVCSTRATKKMFWITSYMRAGLNRPWRNCPMVVILRSTFSLKYRLVINFVTVSLRPRSPTNRGFAIDNSCQASSRLFCQVEPFTNYAILTFLPFCFAALLARFFFVSSTKHTKSFAFTMTSGARARETLLWIFPSLRCSNFNSVKWKWSNRRQAGARCV